MKKRIAIFGGSFNPPHKGHEKIAVYVLKNGDIDEVWIVPCFAHPFGKESVGFEDRVEMCKLAFEKIDKRVKVLDAEKSLCPVSYTYNTVRLFKQMYPENDYALVVGSDTAKDLHLWKDADKLLKEVRLIELPRGANSPIPFISSTEIRQAAHQKRPISSFVSGEVEAYIRSNGLYL